MSRCVPYDRILAFKEGLLPVREQRAVQAHLDECVRCRRELDRIEKTIGLIKEHPGEELVRTPKRLLKSVLAMIPVSEKQKSSATKPFGAIESLRKIVARWITPEGSQLALARSLSVANRTKHHFYEAEGLEIILGIKRQKNGQWAILGELFPEIPSGDVMLSLQDGIGSRKACLERSRKVPLEASRFGFYDVKEGAYVLQIQCGKQVIEIEDVCVMSNEQ